VRRIELKAQAPVQRGKRESGNAMLEAALYFVPLMALMFGILDFSMALFITGTFQSAARDASAFTTTYGLTYAGTTYTTQTAAAKAIVYSECFGFINSTNDAANNYVSVNYYFPDDLTTPATCATNCNHTWTDSNGSNWVVNEDNQPGDVVEVRIQGFPWNWMVPLPGFMPGKSITLNADAAQILQGLPSGMTAPPSP
jgi:Flp pilus assembly protein TadG